MLLPPQVIRRVLTVLGVLFATVATGLPRPAARGVRRALAGVVVEQAEQGAGVLAVSHDDELLAVWAGRVADPLRAVSCCQ